MGIDYTKRPKAGTDPAEPSPAPGQGPAAPPSSAGGGTHPGGVNLGKVTLTKSAPAVSLTKQGSAGGKLRVNLNWNARPTGTARAGLFRKSSGGIDLDLAALYEYADGSRGAVQALGGSFRDRHSFGGEPICWLDGDDRTGSHSGGENLYVDLSRLDKVRRILIFAFIYEGAPSWAQADGVVTLFPATGPQVEVRLDEHDPRARMCAIAMLENTGNDLSVRREVRYVGGHRDLDSAFGWGMRWTAGRK